MEYKEYVTREDLEACNKLNRPMMKDVDWKKYNFHFDKAGLLTYHLPNEFWIKLDEAANSWISNYARIVDFKKDKFGNEFVNSRITHWSKKYGYTNIGMYVDGKYRTYSTQSLMKKYFLPDICWETLPNLRKMDYIKEIHHGIKMRYKHYDFQFIELADFMMPIYKRYHKLGVEKYHFLISYRVNQSGDWLESDMKFAPADLGIRPLDFYEMLLTKADKEKEFHDYYQRKFIDRDGKTVEVEFIFYKPDKQEYDRKWFELHRKEPIYYVS